MLIINNYFLGINNPIYSIVNKINIAKKYGIDPVHMALSWAMMRPFMGSVIFGATTQQQLEHIIAGADLVLSEEVVDEIDAAHKAHPMPY